MSESAVKKVLAKTIKTLECAGDILVVNPNEKVVINKLFDAVSKVSPNLLTASELTGIINALGAHKLGFGLDDSDFQTIIGITKEELINATNKLKPYDKN